MASQASVSVGGNIALIRHVWIGDVADGVMVHIDTLDKHPIVIFSATETDRVFEIYPALLKESEIDARPAKIQVSIPGRDSRKYEIFTAHEERYQFRCLLLPDAGSKCTMHVVFPVQNQGNLT